MDKLKSHIIAGAFYNEVIEGDISSEEVVRQRMSDIANKFMENKWIANELELIEVLIVVDKLSKGESPDGEEKE